METYLEKLKSIKCFIFDVDGVMTNGTVLALESGEQARSFLVKDGYAIEMALLAGYHIVIISGGNQIGVQKRLEFLKIKHIFLGVKNKSETLQQVMTDLQLTSEQIVYMGDDWPDYEVMQLCGLPCCPQDAIHEVKEISLFVSNKKGGKGCVRDIIEKVMRVQHTFRQNKNVSINN